MEIRAKNDAMRRILQASSDGNIAYLETIPKKTLEDARCTSGCTVLHWAAGTEQLDVIRFLIEDNSFHVDIPATRKARGRTPLHYACRNGCLNAAKLLVSLGANVDERAKHGVSPFQMAVWQNHLNVCEWLVEKEKVEPDQVNEFDCGAIHWIGICPLSRANSLIEESGEEKDGSGLLPLAKWLARQRGVDFRKRQRQGHTALHKAAWGGHIALIRYLRDKHGLLDDSQDFAGNYAADLADMANTERHAEVATFLRQHCSAARAESCATLGIPVDASASDIRKAYLRKAKEHHPDRHKVEKNASEKDFDKCREAYQHLTLESGAGSQCNPAHSLNLMLELSGAARESSSVNEDCFKARLIAVLLEYGDKGLDLSNLKKKWKQVWPDNPFPREEELCLDKGEGRKRRMALSDFVQKAAGDVVVLRTDEESKSIRIIPKHCTQEQVAAAALARTERKEY